MEAVNGLFAAGISQTEILSNKAWHAEIIIYSDVIICTLTGIIQLLTCNANKKKKKKPPNIVKARLILVLWSSPNHCQYKVDTLCAAMVIWKTFLSDIYMVHWRFTLRDRVKFYFPVLKRVLREWAEQLGNESDFLTYVLWRRNTQRNNFLVSFLRI